MNNASKLFKDLTRTARRHQPEILAGLSVVGTVATAYFAAKGGRTAERTIQANPGIIPENGSRKDRWVAEGRLTWRAYAPAALIGAATVTATVISATTSHKRTAAALAAYALSEKAYTEYKAIAAEELGVEKEKDVQKKVAERMVESQPPANPGAMDSGEILCCELLTMRYFVSTISKIERAVNEVNRIAIHEGVAYLTDFYDFLNLEYTSMADQIIWEPDQAMTLAITYLAGPNGQPCMAFDYNNHAYK